MKQKVVIIGGGTSGLSAGIYAQMNGFDSEIYEQHIVAGGECTSWNRKGYRIDEFNICNVVCISYVQI